MCNYVYVYISIYTFTRKNWPCFQCKICIYIYISWLHWPFRCALKFPADLTSCGSAWRGENSTTKKVGFRGPKRKGLELPTLHFQVLRMVNSVFKNSWGWSDWKWFFLRQHLLQLVSLQPQDMEDFFGGVFLSWMFSRCGISLYSLWQEIQEEIADDFLIEKTSGKRTTWVHDIFFVNLCFNIFNPSSRQGPNSTHLWVLGLSLGLGFCLNLGFCLRLCLDFMEEEEAKKCQMPHHQGNDSTPDLYAQITNPPTKLELGSSSCLTTDMPKQEAGHLLSPVVADLRSGFWLGFLGLCLGFCLGTKKRRGWKTASQGNDGIGYLKFGSADKNFHGTKRHSGFSSKCPIQFCRFSETMKTIVGLMKRTLRYLQSNMTMFLKTAFPNNIFTKKLDLIFSHTDMESSTTQCRTGNFNDIQWFWQSWMSLADCGWTFFAMALGVHDGSHRALWEAVEAKGT